MLVMPFDKFLLEGFLGFVKLLTPGLRDDRGVDSGVEENADLPSF